LDPADNPNPFSKPIDNSMVAEALKIVRGNREAVYGDPTQNFKTIAAFWSAWLSVRFKAKIELSPVDVCHLMNCMKLARLANTPDHRDSMVDIVGYVDCADRCLSQKAS